MAPPTSLAKYRFRLMPVDFAIASLAPGLALLLRDPALLDESPLSWPLPISYQYWLISSLSGVTALLFFRLSEGISRFFSVREAVQICKAAAAAVGASSFFAFALSRLEGIPRSTPLIFGLLFAGGLIAVRVLRRLLFWERSNAQAIRIATDVSRVLLVGANRFTAAAIRLIDSQPERSLLIVAVADHGPSVMGRKLNGVPVIGPLNELGRIIDEYAVHGVQIDEVWVSNPEDLSAIERRQLEEACDARRLPFITVSEALNLSGRGRKVEVEDASSPPKIVVGDYFERKRFLDIAVALGLGLVLAPVTVLVAILVAADVGVPVIFWQQRIGQNGRKFLLYKFRTYRAPFDAAGNEIPELKRLSKTGWLMRASRLDEIPQLYNILIGDMSLIGPRPLLPHDQPLDPTIRLLVRPGITGWAQINGATMLTPEEKDALDVWYVQHASLALDLRILFGTLQVVVSGQKVKPDHIYEIMQWRRSIETCGMDQTDQEDLSKSGK